VPPTRRQRTEGAVQLLALMTSAGTESFSIIGKASGASRGDIFYHARRDLAGVWIWLFIFEPRRKIYDDV
jgi:hypothetical protein